MRQRITTALAIVFLATWGAACSFLPRVQKLTWHITLEIDKQVPDRDSATKRAMMILESRLNAVGVSGFDVSALANPPDGRIRVSLPQVADRERLKKLLSSEGLLEIAHVVSPGFPGPIKVFESQQAAEASLQGVTPSNRRVLPYLERSDVSAGDISPGNAAKQKWVVVESPPIIDGTDLRKAQAVASYSESDNYGVSFSLSSAGAEKFGNWTANNINEYLAVILNGEVKSTAYIKSKISDSGEISGSFTRQSAEDLALILKSGALPKIAIVEEGPNE